MAMMYAPTPSGLKPHGEIVGDEFRRKVDHHKDRMRIFDAWSIHPRVFEKLGQNNVRTLVYISSDGLIYRISIGDAKKKGFEREFSGGKTLYVPLKYWTVENTVQGKLL